MANTIDVLGDEVAFASIIQKDIVEYIDDSLNNLSKSLAFESCPLVNVDLQKTNYLAENAFATCVSLSVVNIPLVTLIGEKCFIGCTSLKTISAPNLRRAYSMAFVSCSSLSSVYFPSLETLSSTVFGSCSALKIASFPLVSSIASYVFNRCTSLSQIYLLYPSRINLMASTAFSNTPIVDSSYLGYFGSIYVPSSLVSAYKSATNWTYFADRITAYTET